jgi:Lrp/AsnC family transcriptional regulator for asnA, asnC and gidA
MLQQNGRRSYRDIGRRLGVSEATIRARVRKLEKMGIIKKFTALIDPQKAGYKYISLITLKGTPDRLEIIKAQMRNKEEVKALFEATTALELILLTYFHGKQHMKNFIQELGGISGIEMSHISSNLNVSKFDFVVNFDILNEPDAPA